MANFQNFPQGRAMPPVQGQGQAFYGVAPAYAEEIRKCVANGKLSFTIEALYQLVLDKFPKAGKEPNAMDVVTVIKTAVAAGLDPTSDDVFAFKTGDRVIVGISKRGWSKVLDSRGGSVSYEYGPLIPPSKPRSPSRYEWVAATITKRDGTQIQGPRVFSDEFDLGRGVWTSNPKIMLCTRAFTHACAMAFGIGAYDEDEARSIYHQENEVPRAARPAPVQAQVTEPIAVPAVPVLNVAPAHPALQAISAAQDAAALDAVYIQIPPQDRNNPMIAAAYQERKQQLATIPQVSEAQND